MNDVEAQFRGLWQRNTIGCRRSRRRPSDPQSERRANRHDLRIEAVDTTLLYGFKDDVVVRIRSDAGGSRMDVRSVSRVGHSDLGVNAARIRKFLHRVTQEQSGSP